MELRIMFIVILVALTALLIYKGKVRRDFGILGPVAPRILLIIILLFDLFGGNTGMLYFHAGIILIFFTDLVSSIFVIRSKRFFYETYNSELIELLQNLKLKYDFIISNVPVGIFVINRLGRFEFINKTMSSITGYTEDELLKMSVFDITFSRDYLFFEKNIKERIDGIFPEKTYTTNLLTKDGEKVSVKVCEKKTVNGHDTITGSVHILGG